MAASDTFVIAGAGLAGAKAAEALREQGFDGRVVLVGKEVHLPYERPPLSKDYLAGNAERTSFEVHDEAWYTAHEVELRLGTEVIGVDRAGHELELSDGSQLSYTKLLLATGSSPRTLSVPGADADAVHYLRTVGDSERLRDQLGQDVRLVVIGAGWIGLEVAANARQGHRLPGEDFCGHLCRVSRCQGRHHVLQTLAELRPQRFHVRLYLIQQ